MKKKIICAILISSLVAALGISASAATEWESNGVISYDANGDGEPEVYFDTDDFTRMEAAIEENNELLDIILPALENATGSDDVSEAISTLEDAGVGEDSYYTWNDGENSSYTDGQTISESSVWGPDNPNNPDTRVTSAEPRARVANLNVPAGFYNEGKSIYIDLQPNNEYFYLEGLKDYLESIGAPGTNPTTSPIYDDNGNLVGYNIVFE